MSKSVQVAVRVRPFNKRELTLESQLCVSMNGNQTTLQDLNNPDNNKDFTFDHSFWSHDGFQTQPNGTVVPVSSQYADQQKVYDALGKDILENAWQGYHCTLFAYGQTGSGKSYSIMGYKPNVGIVPMACSEIFERIDRDSESKYEVTFSMMEIYNEKLQDLLIPISSRQPNGMKIRESSQLGFFAEGLRKIPVKSFNEIEQRMDEGSRNRSVAATNMNATSSRAHTIVLIEIKQKKQSNGKPVERFSAINLVDLAGSEKTGKTGATGDRLKEASAINKSLSMLGQVISVLADHANGNTSKKIPYRDSVLTKILKNALGGNSKTIMICAISPAQDNYEETLSTLRYANQAKKIKNVAKVNESASDKVIRELKEENDKLAKMLQQLQMQINNQGTSDEIKQEMQQRVDQINEYQDANNAVIMEQLQTENEKLQDDVYDQQQNQEEEEECPMLTNLNEDPMLNDKIKHKINKEKIYLGKSPQKLIEQASDCYIQIKGVGIQQVHCYLYNEYNNVYIEPIDSEEVHNNLFVNGQKVTEKLQLNHNDRIIFGQTQVFLYKSPGAFNNSLQDNELDWEYAQEEMTQQQEQLKQDYEKKLEEEYNRRLEERIKALEEQQQKESQQNESQKEKKKKFDIGEVFSNKLQEAKKKLNSQKFVQKLRLQKQVKKFNQELALIQGKINEMNTICKDHGIQKEYSVYIVTNEEQNLQVKVQNLLDFNDYQIKSKEKFLDEYEMYMASFNNNPVDGYHNDWQGVVPPNPVADSMLQLQQNDQQQQFAMQGDGKEEVIARTTITLDPFYDKDQFEQKYQLYSADPSNQFSSLGSVELEFQQFHHNVNQMKQPQSLIIKIHSLEIHYEKTKDFQIQYTMFGMKYKTDFQISSFNQVDYDYKRTHFLSENSGAFIFNLAQEMIQLEVVAKESNLATDPNNNNINPASNLMGAINQVMTNNLMADNTNAQYQQQNHEISNNNIDIINDDYNNNNNLMKSNSWATEQNNSVVSLEPAKKVQDSSKNKVYNPRSYKIAEFYQNFYFTQYNQNNEVEVKSHKDIYDSNSSKIIGKVHYTMKYYREHFSPKRFELQFNKLQLFNMDIQELYFQYKFKGQHKLDIIKNFKFNKDIHVTLSHDLSIWYTTEKDMRDNLSLMFDIYAHGAKKAQGGAKQRRQSVESDKIANYVYNNDYTQYNNNDNKVNYVPYKANLNYFEYSDGADWEKKNPFCSLYNLSNLFMGVMNFAFFIICCIYVDEFNFMPHQQVEDYEEKNDYSFGGYAGAMLGVALVHVLHTVFYAFFFRCCCGGDTQDCCCEDNDFSTIYYIVKGIGFALMIAQDILMGIFVTSKASEIGGHMNAARGVLHWYPSVPDIYCKSNGSTWNDECGAIDSLKMLYTMTMITLIGNNIVFFLSNMYWQCKHK